MLFVACSGFPVPVSRYWGAYPAVEISDTEIAMPGRGTIRRLKREAPEDFVFTMLAPKALAEADFKKNKEARESLDAVIELAGTLGVRALVFCAPDTFRCTKANRGALSRFAASLPEDGPTPVFHFAAWQPTQILETIGREDVAAAYDPLSEDPPPPGPLRYIRLPGPAGHRSRYDEPSIDRLAEHVKSISTADIDTFCVFANIDMQTNANQLLARLK